MIGPFLLLGLALASGPELAPPPRPVALKLVQQNRENSVVGSADGTHRFKMLPPEDRTLAGPAVGVLVRLNKQRDEQVLWKKKLVNIPHQIFVANNGEYVV